MKRVDGIDLRALETSAADAGVEIPIEIALHLTIEIARALTRGVHGNLGPQAIVVAWDGDITLNDFAGPAAKGASGYAAPEQTRAAQAASDVFALGCLLHQMIAGRSPIEQGGVEPSLPQDVLQIIARATHPNAGGRQTALELAAECRAALSSRIAGDPRALIASWIAQIRPSELRTAIAGSEAAATQVVTALADAPVRDPLIGADVHGFHITAELGRGANARVYRGVHSTLGRELAIKVLDREHSSPGAVARMKREAELLAQIAHPNIVSLVELGATPDGRTLMIMELVHGPTLAEELERSGPMPPERAAMFAMQIASGLQAAHEQGIVHRDLKSKNLILTRAAAGEVVKIVDFGIARATNSSNLALTRITQSGVLLGTPGYMAPEQIEAPASAGPAADLYALGVVLFEMLAGRRPFEGHLMEVLIGHLRTPPPALPPSGGLEAIVQQLLDKDPRRRPTARAVVDAIRALPLEVTALRIPETRLVQRPESSPATTILLAMIVMLAATWLILRARREVAPAVSAPNPPAEVVRTSTAPAVRARAVALPAPVVEESPPAEPAAEPQRIRRRAKPAVESTVTAPPADEPPDPSAIVERLGQISKLIQSAQGTLDPGELDAFETRWFSLRRRAKPSLTAQEAKVLLADAAALERDVLARVGR
jgi:serine/threonine-protein kinase